MSLTNRRWSVPAAAGFAHHHWPGEAEHLLFVPGSGELHLVTADAVAVLRGVARQPSDISGLAALTGQSTETVEAVLQSLERIGLVAPCT